MDKNQSQSKLSDYLSHMVKRESALNFDNYDKQNLSLSDYMDDSVPADVKPSYSLTPMEEVESDYVGHSDIPTQSKDLFKGLWEDVLKNNYEYWMDRDGRFLIAPRGHINWAYDWLMTRRIESDRHNAEDIYSKMFKRQMLRIKVEFGKMYVEYDPNTPPNHVQWRNLKESALESKLKLIDTSGVSNNDGREIDLLQQEEERLPLNENKDNGQLFIESMMPDDTDTFKSHLAQLFAFLQKELQLKSVPKVKLLADEKNANKVLGKTAYYDPETRMVVLYITGRHQKDILRSFSHEIIHHWQHENEKLQTSATGGVKGESPKSSSKDGSGANDPQYAQNNPWLRQMEKQAYLLGNILFRDWEDEKKAKDRKSGKKMVESDRQQIPPETPYGVIDFQTKQVVFKTTYANRNRARRFADKKDLEYGAHRYIPMILRGENLKEKTMVIGKGYPPKRPDYRG